MANEDGERQTKLFPMLAMIAVIATVFTILGYRVGVELERAPEREGWERNLRSVSTLPENAGKILTKSPEGAAAHAPIKVLLHGPVLAEPGAKSNPYLNQYDFTRDAFTPNLPIWEKVLEPLKGRENLRYLEVGLYEGRSALWMLEQVLTHPSSKLVGIDSFGYANEDESVEERFFSNLKLSSAEERVEVIKGATQIELRKLPLESFDVIYISGAHSGSDVLEDAVLSYRLLKNGGLLIFDNYLWNMKAPPVERPQKAVEAFYYFYETQFDIVHADYQVILKRNLPTPIES